MSYLQNPTPMTPCADHAAIDLEFSECIVDLTGGELVSEGHEGMSESFSIDLSVHFESLERCEDNIVIVGSSSHLAGEECHHLGEVHGSVNLVEHGLCLSSANVLAVGSEGS